MSIENFFTLQAYSAPPSGAAGSTAAQPKGLALGQSGIDAEALLEIDFLDLVEAKLNEDQPQDEDGLDLVALLAANPEIEEQVNRFIDSTGISDADALAQTLELNKVAFDNILKPLTDGIITVDEQHQGGTELKLEQLLIDKAKEIKELKLADFAKARHEFKALLESNADLAVAANLTVEETTALETGEVEDQEMLDSILGKISAALIQIVQPDNEQSLEDLPLDDPALLNAIAILSPRNGVKSANDNALAAQLNALTVGGSESGALGESYQSFFDAIKEQLGFAATKEDGGADDLSSGKASADKTSGSPTPNLSFLQSGVFDLSNPLLAGLDFVNGVAEQYAVNLNSSSALSTGIATSAVTQAQSAAQAHPATQLIAATIQKGAASGETKNLTIRLDPPELGKLNAELHFGKEKTLKAIITVEKPETYLMLQRDSSALERSLADAGLDLSGGGLSFELAEQGFDFDDGNQRGGGHNQGGTGAGGSGGEAEEIIQSTMTWHVDPESGMTRYDIWA